MGPAVYVVIVKMGGSKGKGKGAGKKRSGKGKAKSGKKGSTAGTAGSGSSSDVGSSDSAVVGNALSERIITAVDGAKEASSTFPTAAGAVDGTGQATPRLGSSATYEEAARRLLEETGTVPNSVRYSLYAKAVRDLEYGNKDDAFNTLMLSIENIGEGETFSYFPEVLGMLSALCMERGEIKHAIRLKEIETYVHENAMLAEMAERGDTGGGWHAASRAKKKQAKVVKKKKKKAKLEKKAPPAKVVYRKDVDATPREKFQKVIDELKRRQGQTVTDSEAVDQETENSPSTLRSVTWADDEDDEEDEDDNDDVSDGDDASDSDDEDQSDEEGNARARAELEELDRVCSSTLPSLIVEGKAGKEWISYDTEADRLDRLSIIMYRHKRYKRAVNYATRAMTLRKQMGSKDEAGERGSALAAGLAFAAEGRHVYLENLERYVRNVNRQTVIDAGGSGLGQDADGNEPPAVAQAGTSVDDAEAGKAGIDDKDKEMTDADEQKIIDEEYELRKSIFAVSTGPLDVMYWVHWLFGWGHVLIAADQPEEVTDWDVRVSMTGELF